VAETAATSVARAKTEMDIAYLPQS
jgi:hypothetical protein